MSGAGKAVAAAMIGESVPVLTTCKSAIAEMGNIITGQATIGLEDGHACKLTPPPLQARE